MPIEHPRSVEAITPEGLATSITDRALRRFRDNQQRKNGTEAAYPRDASEAARELIDHRDALSATWAIMPECPMKDQLFHLIPGHIERRSENSPLWALSADDMNLICDILGMTEQQLGFRRFGGDILPENHPHSFYTHYLDTPLPVMLLLRTKIDQAYRDAKKQSESNGEFQHQSNRRNTMRESLENAARLLDEEQLQNIMDQLDLDQEK